MSLSPPRPKGPPLKALWAFEAAARLGGFTAAAHELCVTPGAVAQQVKALEAWAGAKLFDRRAHGVELTALGVAALDDFGPAFDHLGDAVQALRQRSAPRHIRIATLPSIAQLWLSPRLPGLRHAVPGVTFSITAMESAPNLRREPFDLSLFMEEREPGLDVADGLKIQFEPEVIFPVCAPEIAEGLENVEDLRHQIFLHDVAWKPDWDAWMAQALPLANIDMSGPVYSLYSLAVEEAKNGAGVLMGHQSLVRPLLESGVLVEPFKQRCTLAQAMVLSRASTSGKRAELDIVMEVLRRV